MKMSEANNESGSNLINTSEIQGFSATKNDTMGSSNTIDQKFRKRAIRILDKIIKNQLSIVLHKWRLSKFKKSDMSMMSNTEYTQVRIRKVSHDENEF